MLRRGPCGHCGRDTIGGWSGTGNVLAVQVTVDADPLTTPEEELQAVVAGCLTWTLHPLAGQLHARTAYMIRQRPVGSSRWQAVHPEHRCPIPGAERGHQ